MCGLAGYVTRSSAHNLKGALRGMPSTIAHRGQNDEGFLESGMSEGQCRLGLAHRGLFIMDISTCHQPMGNEDDSTQMIWYKHYA